MFDVEYGDLSTIPSRLGLEPKEDCRETRFKDKRMRKRQRRNERNTRHNLGSCEILFIMELWLRNSLICLEKSRVSAGARLRATGNGECGWHGDLKQFFSCRMKVVTNAAGDGRKLSVLLTLHKKKLNCKAFSLT